MTMDHVQCRRPVLDTIPERGSNDDSLNSFEYDPEDAQQMEKGTIDEDSIEDVGSRAINNDFPEEAGNSTSTPSDGVTIFVWTSVGVVAFASVLSIVIRRHYRKKYNDALQNKADQDEECIEVVLQR